MREAVHYKRSNKKWTASEFQAHGDGHANALLEYKFPLGDRLLLFLPESWEKHTVMWAALRAGYHIIDCHPSTVANYEDMRKVLKLAQCKSIYFDVESESKDNMELLRKTIPEYFHYDDTYGQMFHSKYFPTMKYFFHTGFEQELGAVKLDSIYLNVPSQPYINFRDPDVSENAPLYTQIIKGKEGGDFELVPSLTQKEVFNHEKWHFLKKISNQEFFEVITEDV